MMINMMEKRGFTLIELMVVVLIIGVIAAIALPSYSRYVRNSARADAQSQMLRLAGDLERWRAKNLSYAGFTPESGYDYAPLPLASNAISVATNVIGTTTTSAIIYLPKGSDKSNYQYQLALLDGANRTASLTGTSTTSGQRWILIGQPNTTNATMNLASRLVLSSQGVRCMTDTAVTDTTMKSNIAGTGTDASLCIGTSLTW